LGVTMTSNGDLNYIKKFRNMEMECMARNQVMTKKVFGSSLTLASGLTSAS
jgi:hypothetical protein